MKFFDSIKDLPPRHKDPATQKGNVDKLYYKTKGIREEEYEKYCFVYTPFGYDETKAYDIVYLLHGMEDVCDNCFYKGGFKDVGGEPTWKKYMMDCMIQQKESRPFIVAAVEWYPDAGKFETDRTIAFESMKNFPNELTKDIIPAVEAKYHGYSNFKTDPESLIATRDHRAVLGWSAGSMTTWEIIRQKAEYFRFYNPESGGANFNGQSDDFAGNAAILADSLREKGLSAKDLVIFMTTGDEDFTCESMNGLAKELKNHKDLFVFDGDDPNCAYLVLPGGNHHTWFRRIYQYNALLTFFPPEE